MRTSMKLAIFGVVVTVMALVGSDHLPATAPFVDKLTLGAIGVLGVVIALSGALGAVMEINEEMDEIDRRK